jgi:hypothetical protein
MDMVDLKDISLGFSETLKAAGEERQIPKTCSRDEN